MYDVELNATYRDGRLEVEDREWSALFGYNHQREPEAIRLRVESPEAVPASEVYAAMDALMDEKDELIQDGYKEATSGMRMLQYVQTGVGLFIAGTFGLVYWATGDLGTSALAAGAVAFGAGPIDMGVAWAMRDEGAKRSQIDDRLKRLDEHRYDIELEAAAGASDAPA